MNLKIEKVIYGGQGLARIPAESEGRGGMSVFVPFTLPGETVAAEITQQHRGYCVAEAREVVEASEFRSVPPCPWFANCGGCHLQHSVYPYQLELKRQMLVESLTRAGIQDLPIVSLLHGDPLGYRNRIRLQAQMQPEFDVGYRQAKSHRMTAIDGCPIAAPLLEKCIQVLRLMGAQGLVPAETHELEMFTNHDQSELLLTLWARPRGNLWGDGCADFFARMQKEIPQLSGAQVFTAKPGKAHTSRPQFEWGQQALHYRVAGREYTVHAASFFQVNRTLLEEFVSAVAGAESGRCAWDLYAGVGLFSMALMERFQRVFAVESNPSAVHDLRQNLSGRPGEGGNAEVIQSTTLDFLKRVLQRREATPDLVLLDPPRAGAGAEACQLLVRCEPQTILYVSCDPATLGRDLGTLMQSGYSLHGLQLVDMFPQTYHMEIIATLQR